MAYGQNVSSCDALKGKDLASKCVFQNYSQLLDNFTRPVSKTAEEHLVLVYFEVIVIGLYQLLGAQKYETHVAHP